MIMSQFCRIVMTATLVIGLRYFSGGDDCENIHVYKVTIHKMFAHHEVFVHISPQLRPTSIEKEIFPRMARDDDLFAYNLSGKLFFVLN